MEEKPESEIWTERFLRFLSEEREASVHTLRNYGMDIRAFLSYLRAIRPGDPDLRKVDALTIRAFLSHLHEKNARVSIARRLAALRSFFRFLHREGYSENEAILVPAPRAEKKLPVYLSVEEMER